MDRKKRLASIVALLTISAMLISCGEKSAESVNVAEDPVAKAADTEAAEEVLEKEEAEAEEAAAEDAIASTNTMAVKAPDFEGLTNLTNNNFDDGTYYYEDITEDGDTVITNMCYRNSQSDGQDMDAYAENFVCAQINSDARITASSQDEELTEALTYPVFKIDYESGSSEDTKQAVGVVILTDNFTYYYGFECAIDFFEDYQETYEEELKKTELIELSEVEAPSSEDFANNYLKIATDYDKEKTADSFALIYVKGNDIPFLAAVNSEGPLEYEGNAHLFSVKDGKLNPLLSVNSGFDGEHLYISAGTNTFLHTHGMSGTENYDLYTFDGEALKPVKEIQALYNMDDDSYTYYDGDTEVTEDQYFELFEKFISDNNPYTGIDYDGLNMVNVTITDGYANYETDSTQKYMSFDEIKNQLIDLGAQAP